jgi:hypothetical protein
MIYVDDYVTRRQYPKARMKRCRMVADSIPELHKFALTMNIPRSAFMYPPEHPFPHYDIGTAQREYAVANGATEVSRERFEELALECKRK